MDTEKFSRRKDTKRGRREWKASKYEFAGIVLAAVKLSMGEIPRRNF